MLRSALSAARQLQANAEQKLFSLTASDDDAEQAIASNKSGEIAARENPASADETAGVTKVKPQASAELRDAFDDFVGQNFYGQMLKSMRKSVGKPAYFHGGSAEEMFQTQLDQVLVEKMSDATANSITGPMFDLFMLGQAK